ncbi:MAG TPA: hypothetical protein PKV72_03860 [Candidatus Peribacteria bacterium]|nr:hypothetical protein [Candidatus Peribacteria bacterium]
MSQYQSPWWTRITDLLAGFFSYGVAGIGGIGIIVYQAVIWFIYTTFNYMSLEWLFRQLHIPFFTSPSSWYNAPQTWPQVQQYVVLFFQWMPLSISLMIVGKVIGGWIDNAAMDFERAHRRPNTDDTAGRRGLGA